MTIREYIKVVMQGAKGYIDERVLKTTVTVSNSTIALDGVTELVDGTIISFTLPSDVNGPIISVNNQTYPVMDVNSKAIMNMSGEVAYLFVYSSGTFFMAGGGSGTGSSSQVVRHKETIFPSYDGQHEFTLSSVYSMGGNCLDVIIDGVPQPASLITEIDNRNFSIDEEFVITTETQIDVSYYQAIELVGDVTVERFCILYASEWTGNTYTLGVNGVTTTSVQEILPALNINDEQLEALQAANLIDAGQNTNAIILKAHGEVPTVDIPLRVLVRGEIKSVSDETPAVDTLPVGTVLHVDANAEVPEGWEVCDNFFTPPTFMNITITANRWADNAYSYAVNGYDKETMYCRVIPSDYASQQIWGECGIFAVDGVTNGTITFTCNEAVPTASLNVTVEVGGLAC